MAAFPPEGDAESDRVCRSRPRQYAPLGRLWGYARPHWPLILLGATLTFLGGATGLVQPLMAKYVIDSLEVGDPLTGPVLVLAIVVIGGAVVSAGGSFLLERTGQTVVLDVRRWLVGRLVRLKVTEVEQIKPGDLVSRLTADTTLLRAVVTNAIANAATSAILLVGAVLIMIYLDTWLFLVTTGLFLLVVLLMGIVLPRIGRATEASQAALGRMGSMLERIFGAYQTVKASSAEAAEVSRLETAALRSWRAGVAVAGWQALSGTAVRLAVNIAFLTIMGVGGARVASGALQISDLIAFLLLLFYVMEPVNTLVQSATELQTGLAAIRRIDEVRGLETEKTTGLSTPPSIATTEAASVALEDVSFRYAPDLPFVHEGVSFAAHGPGLTALVGPSGAGKSTVFALLERFHEPTSGTVRVDGVDVNDWPLAALRGTIGYVEQDAPVLDGTLRENLLMASPDATEAQLREVMRRGRLMTLVERLPEGLDSVIGHRGSTLSGGERQRVAIARALLRRPRILLMDEATSQLDAVNEAELRQAMLEAAEQATVIVVAHRLSTVTNADRIVVLESGFVQATGTHRELVEAEGLYRDLVASQMLTAP